MLQPLHRYKLILCHIVSYQTLKASPIMIHNLALFYCNFSYTKSALIVLVPGSLPAENLTKTTRKMNRTKVVEVIFQWFVQTSTSRKIEFLLIKFQSICFRTKDGQSLLCFPISKGPSYTDQIFLQPIFASFTDKTWSQNCHNFPGIFANFSQWLHLNNLFNKTSTLTPFVKPRQVLFWLSHCKVSETRGEIVTVLWPYFFFAKWTASDGRESILSV